MGTPTGGRVAQNVRELRTRRGLSHRNLSSRLTELGRKILPSGIVKIEQGERRVDTEDLVALALALGTTPNRLLLTGTVRDDTVMLTPTEMASQVGAWWWATGEQRLPGPFSPPEQEFVAENRPHDPPDTVTLDELLKFEANGQLNALRESYDAARAAGLEPKTILNYLRLQEQRRTREELAQIEADLFGSGLKIDPKP
jgi:transcriptional regulator with XRE-family HTH domain